MKAQKVYLVGSGPGRPDLITVRGLNILKEADVVIYDYLVDKRLLENAKQGAELISCEGLGKKRYSGQADSSQKKINNLIVKKAKEKKRVVRLKSGDVSIFSRCSEEIAFLVKNNIEFEIVPGITAASSASAFTGAPLTDRKYSRTVAFISGKAAHTKEQDDLDFKAIASFGTIVIYMGVGNISKIVERLVNAGKSKSTAVLVVSQAGQINQKTVRGKLNDIAEKVKGCNIKAPAIFIIGKTAGLEQRFNWFKKNKRVLFTGLSKERFFIPGTYEHVSLIKIEPLKDYTGFDGYLREMGHFDWIVFVSRYGVEYFFKRLNKIGSDSRTLKGIKIAAIGGSTKNRLFDFGISADFVPKKESAAGLVDEFKELAVKGKRVFLPRSDISGKNLGAGLKKLGAEVIESPAYRNLMPESLPDIDFTEFDEIVFTSPSTVRNFKTRYGDVPDNVTVRCIGDVTLKEAKRCRLLD